MDERRRRRWPLALAALALILVGGRAALPVAFEVALERVLAGVLNADIEIGDVDLVVYEGEIALRRAVMRTREGEELLKAGSLVLDLDWGALATGTLAGERLSIEEPELLLAFEEDGRFNWAALGGDAEKEKSAGEEEPAAAFHLALERFELGTGTLRLVDRGADAVPEVRLGMGGLTLDGLEFERPEPGAALRWGIAGADTSQWQLWVAPDAAHALDFAVELSADPMTPDGRLPLHLAFRREDGGKLELDGLMRPVPLEIDARIRWEEIRPRALMAILSLGGAVPERGRTTGELTLSLTLADVPERGLHVRGEATAHDLAVDFIGRNETRVELAQAEVELSELFVPIPEVPAEVPDPIVLHVARVHVEKPLVDTTLGPDTGGGAGGEEVEDVDDGGPALEILLDALSVRDGRYIFRDPSLGPDHTEDHGSISVNLSGFRWPGPTFESANFVIGTLGARPLRIEGTAPPGKADVQIRAGRIALPPWNPIITRYSDYSISEGALSIRGDARLRGERYDAPMFLTLHRLEATSEGDAFQKTFGMPLAAAIPLLSDRGGNINLKLPISGTLARGATVDVPALVNAALREAIKNAITSTLSAPVDLTGSVLRRVGEAFLLGIGEAAFTAGDASLEPGVKLVLGSAAAIVKQTRNGYLELVPEVVQDDLAALDVDDTGGTGDKLLSVGRALVGGSRVLKPASRKRVAPLVESRFASIERHLRDQAGLAPAQIRRKAWDGRVGEGIPRVLLRLRKK